MDDGKQGYLRSLPMLNRTAQRSEARKSRVWDRENLRADGKDIKDYSLQDPTKWNSAISQASMSKQSKKVSIQSDQSKSPKRSFNTSQSKLNIEENQNSKQWSTLDAYKVKKQFNVMNRKSFLVK